MPLSQIYFFTTVYFIPFIGLVFYKDMFRLLRRNVTELLFLPSCNFVTGFMLRVIDECYYSTVLEIFVAQVCFQL